MRIFRRKDEEKKRDHLARTSSDSAIKSDPSAQESRRAKTDTKPSGTLPSSGSVTLHPLVAKELEELLSVPFEKLSPESQTRLGALRSEIMGRGWDYFRNSQGKVIVGYASSGFQVGAQDETWKESGARPKGLIHYTDRYGNRKWGTPSEVLKWKGTDDNWRYGIDKIVSFVKDEFLELDDSNFELFVHALLQYLGYSVEKIGHGFAHFKATRELHGLPPLREVMVVASIFLSRDELAKHMVVSESAVIGLMDAILEQGAQKGVIVTNADGSHAFAEAAASRASGGIEGRPIELWARERVASLIERDKDNFLKAFVDFFTPLVERMSSVDQLSRQIDGLTPEEFEVVIGMLFSRMGYDVEDRPFVGDQGADLIARKANEVVVIQCKKYGTSNMVTAPDIQRTLGAMLKFRATQGILATTSGFTLDGIEQAKDVTIPLDLWDRRKVLEMLSKHGVPAAKNSVAGV